MLLIFTEQENLKCQCFNFSDKNDMINEQLYGIKKKIKIFFSKDLKAFY